MMSKSRASSSAERFILSAHPQVSTPHDDHISPFRSEGVGVGGPGSVGEPIAVGPTVLVDQTHTALRAGRTSRKVLPDG